MSRIIKFRFYIVSAKKMLDWQYIIDTPERSLFHLEETKDRKVMQFTGLLDKNGKEIWEGDIVKSISEFNSYTGMDSDIYGGNIYQIEWRGVHFALFPEPIINHSVQWKNIEVIGNIYENPDLI